MNYEMFAIIGILLYIINVKEENIMDIKETKLNDGTILTPIESLFSKEQTQKLSEMINSPEYQNYAAIRCKSNYMRNLVWIRNLTYLKILWLRNNQKLTN